MSDAVSTEVSLSLRAEYLTGENLKLAASLLYQSYQDDAVFIEILNGDKPDYAQRLRAFIREELSVFWQAKQPMVGLFSGETLVGVACLNSQDHGFDSNRFWHWRLKMMLSAGYLSTKQMIEKEKIIAAAVPLKSYYMLTLIAVHPLHQHNGLGHFLMKTVNHILDEQSLIEGIVVYATTEKHQKFFSDLAYEVVKDLQIGNVSGSLMLHHRVS